MALADERSEITRCVEALSSYVERLEASYTNVRSQVGQLAPALRGELVPKIRATSRRVKKRRGRKNATLTAI